MRVKLAMIGLILLQYLFYSAFMLAVAYFLTETRLKPDQIALFEHLYYIIFLIFEVILTIITISFIVILLRKKRQPQEP
jgi:hypothetical protein